MSNDHQAYLAAKYMSGPKAQAILVATTKSKLRKKSKKDQNVHETITQADGSSSGLKLRDEDHSGWDAGPDGDDLAPVVEEIASFKAKTSASNWTVLQAPKMDLTEPPKDILDKEDEQPLIVNTEKDTFQGGLQTAEQMKKHLKHKISRTHLPNEEQPEQETIYRDGQGRKIDTKQQRADEKRRQAKELEKEMKKMQWGKGLIQREEKKAGAEELSKIASQPFARTIDDKELNQELKEKQRWNDPAASFLTVSLNSPNPAPIQSLTPDL